MRKKNLKIQNLAGNTLKSCLHSGSQISTTLVNYQIPEKDFVHLGKFLLELSNLAENLINNDQNIGKAKQKLSELFFSLI